MRIDRHALIATAAVGLVLSAEPVAAHAQTTQPAAAPPAAATQQAAANNDGVQQVSEVVVTGTSIRGLVAPVGAPTTSLNQAEVKATGATNTVDLLANIPQISAFGTTPHGNPSATTSFAIPSLRNLTTQQGDGTLFLFNGNRMVGGGFSTRPDPSIIPPGALDRVEVVMGGGSAVYGSDAIAGTINFITRRSLNGGELSTTYGGAGHYRSYDLNGAWGKVWDTGNFLVAVDYAGHSDILGLYRDYSTSNNTANGGTDYRVAFCNQPNITIGKTTYAYPGLAANTKNLCDPSKATDIYPSELRRGVQVSFNQKILDNLEFDFDAYYSIRTDRFLNQPTSAKGTIRSTNPFFIAPSSAAGATSESLGFDFADAFGDEQLTDQHFRTWQYIPSLKWKIGGGWQATGTVNVGYGSGIVHAYGLNTNAYTAALAGTTTATALDPFNLAQTNPGVLGNIQNWDQYDMRIHKMLQEKLVFDGPIWELPGGAARLAVGAERYYESQFSISDAGPFGQEVATGGIAPAYGSRVVHSVFAELVAPLVGPENGIPGVHRLTFDISGRYDRYSDFGKTENPRFAANWEPFADLTIRGDYSTAFVAPSLNSTTKPQVAQIQAITSLIPPGGVANAPSIVLQGGNPDLQPETAKIYDIGFDYAPHFLPGLRVSSTYYHIDFRNLIGGPNPNLFFTQPGWQRYYIVNPTPAQLAAFVGSVPRTPNVPLDFFGAPQIVVDSRTNNLGEVIATGIDYSVRYTVDTAYGTVTPAISGTHGLRLDSSNPTGSPFVSNFDNGYPRDTFTASLTWAKGPAIGRLTLDYLGGFPVLGVTNQTHVDPFMTVNLYASYDLPERGFMRATTISVHLDNILDRAPSYENIVNGVINGSTFGRYMSISLKKKFN